MLIMERQKSFRNFQIKSGKRIGSKRIRHFLLLLDALMVQTGNKSHPKYSYYTMNKVDQERPMGQSLSWWWAKAFPEWVFQSWLLVLEQKQIMLTDRSLCGTSACPGLEWLREWGSGVCLFHWAVIPGRCLCETHTWITYAKELGGKGEQEPGEGT